MPGSTIPARLFLFSCGPFPPSQFWIFDFGLDLPQGRRSITTVIRFGAGDRGRSKCLHDFTRQRHWVQGRGLASKVRHFIPKMQPFEKCAILEKPEDSFEDAHHFPRCARKTRTRRKGTGSVTGSGRLASPVSHSQRSVLRAVLTQGIGFGKRRPSRLSSPPFPRRISLLTRLSDSIGQDECHGSLYAHGLFRSGARLRRRSAAPISSRCRRSIISRRRFRRTISTS